MRTVAAGACPDPHSRASGARCSGDFAPFKSKEDSQCEYATSAPASARPLACFALPGSGRGQRPLPRRQRRSKQRQQDELIAGELNFDANATGYKAIAGWRFLDWLAVEGNYVDLGSGDDKVAGQKIETDVMAVSRCRRSASCRSVRWIFSRASVRINWNADVNAADLGQVERRRHRPGPTASVRSFASGA